MLSLTLKLILNHAVFFLSGKASSKAMTNRENDSKTAIQKFEYLNNEKGF